MSDCSTAAMLPKEPPKTCGTCANVYERILKCHYAANGSFTERTTCEDSKSCSQYVERQDTLEQRYGQLEQKYEIVIAALLDSEERQQNLEQTALRMYKALEYCSGGCFDGCPMLRDGCMVVDGRLHEDLKTLKVSFDD